MPPASALPNMINEGDVPPKDASSGAVPGDAHDGAEHFEKDLSSVDKPGAPAAVAYKGWIAPDGDPPNRPHREGVPYGAPTPKWHDGNNSDSDSDHDDDGNGDQDPDDAHGLDDHIDDTSGHKGLWHNGNWGAANGTNPTVSPVDENGVPSAGIIASVVIVCIVIAVAVWYARRSKYRMSIEARSQLREADHRPNRLPPYSVPAPRVLMQFIPDIARSVNRRGDQRNLSRLERANGNVSLFYVRRWLDVGSNTTLVLGRATEKVHVNDAEGTKGTKTGDAESTAKGSLDSTASSAKDNDCSICLQCFSPPSTPQVTLPARVHATSESPQKTTVESLSVTKPEFNNSIAASESVHTPGEELQTTPLENPSEPMPIADGTVTAPRPVHTTDNDLQITPCESPRETNLDEETLRLRACGHQFHAKCLKSWIKKRKSTCPMCRANFFEPNA